MSAFDFTARAMARRAQGAIPATFAELALRSVPSSIERVQGSGHHVAGIGAAAYVSDALCDEAFLAAHPACVFRSANGRIFRLAPEDGRISVEQVGARGGSYNDQAAFQAAIDYARAIGCKVVALTQHAYTVCGTVRTGHPTTADAHHLHDGKPIVIAADQQVTLIGVAAEKACITFRNVTGDSFEGTTPGTNFQIVMGEVWRGPGFFLATTETDPGEGNQSKLRLENLIVDGGCGKTADFGWPADPLDGDGWDTSHKGVWVEPARSYGGFLEIVDCEFRGWRGESIYNGNGFGPGEPFNDDLYTLVENCVVRDSNAQGLNPMVKPMVDGFLAVNCSTGYEGHLWNDGYVVNAVFEDCYYVDQTGGDTWFQGGCWSSADPVDWRRPQRSSAGQVPAGRFEATFRRCANVNVGPWVHARLILVDTGLVLGNSIVTTQGTFECDLGVTLVTDQTNRAKVTIGGGAGVAGEMRTDRVNLAIHHVRTSYAAANSINPASLVEYWGSLGPDIRVHLTGAPGGQNPANPIALHDYAPKFTGDLDYVVFGGTALHNVETTPAIDKRCPVVQLTTTNAGTFTATMPPNKIGRGTECLLVNVTSNATIQFNGNTGAAMRYPAWIVLPPGARMRMRFDGFFWYPLDAVSPARGVVAHSGNAVTMGLAERNAVARFTHNGGAVAYTLPPNSSLRLSIGDGGEVHHAGSSTMAFVAGAGVTIQRPPGKTLNTLGQGSTVFWRYVATDTYKIWGDLA